VFVSCTEIPDESEPPIETEIPQEKEVINITFVQDDLYDLNTFNVSMVTFRVTYEDETTELVNLDSSMLSIYDQTLLTYKGLHEITFTYRGYQKDIVIYIVDLDPGVTFNTVFFQPPTEKIPSNLFDLSMVKICFEYSNGTIERFDLPKTLVDPQDIKEPYGLGTYYFNVSILGFRPQFNVTMTYPDIVYTDDRELYTGELPDDILEDISVLFDGYPGDFYVQARIILITYDGFILYDGKDHVFIEYPDVDELKINDEVLVDLKISYHNGHYRYIADDVKLIQRYTPHEVLPTFYEIRNYLEDNKVKDRELKYRFRGMFTYLNDELIFTNGVYELKNLTYDEATYNIIKDYIHVLIDINFYFRDMGNIPTFILDDSDLGLYELDGLYVTAYHEFFLDLEIKHILNDLPKAIHKSERLPLVSQGIFGHPVVWSTQFPSIISKEGVVQPGVNSYTCTSIYFVIDNGKLSKGRYKEFCITVGTQMTLKQADTITLDSYAEVIVYGRIIRSIYGISIIYDGTSYALVKYDGKVGDVIEVHGSYERYQGYVGGISFPYLVRPSTRTYLEQEVIFNHDFINLPRLTNMGRVYEANVRYVGYTFSTKWDAFQAMGGLPYQHNKGVFIIDGTEQKINVIGEMDIDFSAMEHVKLQFIFIGINSNQEIEGIFVRVNN
jgi:hypothetical protein